MSEITDLHRPFEKFLREQGIEYIRCRSDKKSTIEKGFCDFTLLHPRLPALLIEFKQEKNSYLSADQKKVHARLESRGFHPLVIRTMAAAVEAVLAWQGTGPGRKDSNGYAFEPKTQEGQLFRYGQAVFRKINGSNEFVRKATAEDAGLPLLGNT